MNANIWNCLCLTASSVCACRRAWMILDFLDSAASGFYEENNIRLPVISVPVPCSRQCAPGTCSSFSGHSGGDAFLVSVKRKRVKDLELGGKWIRRNPL